MKNKYFIHMLFNLYQTKECSCHIITPHNQNRKLSPTQEQSWAFKTKNNSSHQWLHSN